MKTLYFKLEKSTKKKSRKLNKQIKSFFRRTNKYIKPLTERLKEKTSKISTPIRVFQIRIQLFLEDRNIHFPKPNLRLTLLAVFIVSFLGGLFVLIFPLWPSVSTVMAKREPNVIHYPLSFPTSYVGKLQTSDESNQKPIPTENRLIIPKIGVDSEILEGSSLDVLLTKEGVWREPESVTPEDIGNMVIAGHRFQFLPPNTNTFYNLEEVVPGDEVVVFWHSKAYIYTVFDTETVPPTETEIRNSDPAIPHEITIYTCTPLYTSQNRFVVKAKLTS